MMKPVTLITRNILIMLALVVIGNVVARVIVPGIQKMSGTPTTTEVADSKLLIAQLREDMSDLQSVKMRADILSQTKPFGPMSKERMSGLKSFARYVADDYNETAAKVGDKMLRYLQLPEAISIELLDRGFNIKYTQQLYR